MEHTVEHEELVAAAALDALEPEDRIAFEVNLVGCQACREELVEFQEVAGALALAAPSIEPPPDLKRNILTWVLDESRVGGGAPAPVADLAALQQVQQRRPSRAPQRWLAGAAAALLLVVGGGWTYDSIRDAQQQQQRSEVLANIATDPETHKVVLEDLVTGNTQATVLMKQGDVIVSAAGLPVNAPEQMYVLWAEDSRGNLVALDSFSVAPDQRGPVLHTEMSGPVRAIAISLEAAGELPEKPTFAVARGVLEDL